MLPFLYELRAAARRFGGEKECPICKMTEEQFMFLSENVIMPCVPGVADGQAPLPAHRYLLQEGPYAAFSAILVNILFLKILLG